MLFYGKWIHRTKKINIQKGAYLTICWTQYDVPFFWFERLTYFMIFPSMAMNKSSALVFLAARFSKLKNNRRQCTARFNIFLQFVYYQKMFSITGSIVFNYFVSSYSVPDWVNEVFPSSIHHTCMNQKTKIRWFDTQLETRENLTFRVLEYKPIIINPMKGFIIHSKYFPNSDWLKARA